MTPGERSAAEAREAWKAEQLAKVGPMTREQQRESRRLLLPVEPLPRPVSA